MSNSAQTVLGEEKKRHSRRVSMNGCLDPWYSTSKKCTKCTQAFDTPHSICRCSSGLVCDKSQLPKILAPRAHGNIELLFLLLVFFCLVRNKKHKDKKAEPKTHFQHTLWACASSCEVEKKSGHGNHFKMSKITRLLFMVILTWPLSTM